MRKSLAILLAALSLNACEEDQVGANPTVKNSWELIAIKTADKNWQEVPAQQKHFLHFFDEPMVRYTDNQVQCIGNYSIDQIESSEGSERLTLKVPCMVPAEQLWWEFLILNRSNDEVIVLPTLNPTAMASYELYKYRVVQDGGQ